MKAFIISLSKIESSLSTATQMIIPLKKMNFEVELFEGTYGDDAVILAKNEGRTLYPYDHKGKLVSDNFKLTGPGVIGCFYSHYRLWQKCIELNEPICIFEDDVIFIRDYIPVEFNEILIIALGSWICKTDINIEPSVNPTVLEFKGNCMPGAVGYGITPIAANKLVSKYSNTYTATDVAINKSVVDIKIHSHIIGRALVKEDGKISLTSYKKWIK